MVKLLTHAGRCTGRYLALAALTTTLVACGGSSGDSTDLDSDGDGIPDIDDSDADGDGIDDIIGEQDLDGDGIPNKDDLDADNDGLLDAGLDDKFVDLDGDGFDDVTGLAEGPANFEAITADAPCGGEDGTDAYSVDASWDNNCLIRRSNVIGEGQFADSLYAVGVQRVVYCSGFGSGDTYADFADGEYGPLSEQALQEFQASQPNPISDDGQVGPQTWAKLQNALVRLVAPLIRDDGTFPPDEYGFETGRCAGVSLFYQSGTFDTATQTRVEGGWRLVKNAPSTESIPFSIDPPFGRLD